MIFNSLETVIASLDNTHISANRKVILDQLKDFIAEKRNQNEAIHLNFICTHNSRRSHLSQIWAQTLAGYYGITNVFCYSGGTEATAMFPMVGKTLEGQGFEIEKLSEADNPVYAVKYSANHHPVICFSKKYDAAFNPKKGFAAVMTCSSADQGCPLVLGADARIALTFDDPKAFDDTPQQAEKYLERSLQIASELKYVFENLA